jgi:hypothetical protein
LRFCVAWLETSRTMHINAPVPPGFSVLRLSEPAMPRFRSTYLRRAGRGRVPSDIRRSLRRPSIPNSLRTAAAELPTLSTAFCNSSSETLSARFQYFTSWDCCILILLRSGCSRFVRLFSDTPRGGHGPLQGFGDYRRDRALARGCRSSQLNNASMELKFL